MIRKWLSPTSRTAAATACAAAALGLYSCDSRSDGSEPNRLARWEAKWANADTRWHLTHGHTALSR